MCLVGSSQTLVRAKIEANLPRKRGATVAGYDKAWSKFLDHVFTAVVRHVDFNIVKCLVIAGPGFAKESFKEYLELEAVRREVRGWAAGDGLQALLCACWPCESVGLRGSRWPGLGKRRWWWRECDTHDTAGVSMG